MSNIFKILFRVKKRRIVIKRKRAKNKNYLKYKIVALELAKNRLEYFNTFYNLKYNRVSIKNQKTRWGSCSRKGNLNFNYKIALLPSKMSDYIIVHELCHLAEFNHSQNFWNLVAEQIPDYKEIRADLHKNGSKIES